MEGIVKAIIVTVCIIGVLEWYAMYIGMDGKILAGSIAAMTGLVSGYAGYRIKAKKVEKESGGN